MSTSGPLVLLALRMTLTNRRTYKTRFEKFEFNC